MPSWTLALDGAKAELATLPTDERRRRTREIAFFAVRELFYTLKLVPFAVRAARHRAALTLWGGRGRGRCGTGSLPQQQQQEAGAGSRAAATNLLPSLLAFTPLLPTNVFRHSTQSGKAERQEHIIRLQKNVAYGPGKRNLLDVYWPEASASGKAESGGAGGKRPVVLFVHGGVWSSGELWHYSAMGSDLAREGCVVVVATYNFFPDALVGDQVADVNGALDWVLEHAESYGGCRSNVTMVGHSSGAHLSMMSLLTRALGARKPGAMPRSAVLMAGVYDIFRHYQYESHRGVNSLSAMARAMGGIGKMKEFSPAVLLSSDEDGGSAVVLKRTRSTSVGSAEAVRQEIREYEKERAKLKERLRAGVEEAHSQSSTHSSGSGGSSDNGAGAGDNFPQIHLFSGVHDDVVPHYWSSEFLEILQERGVDARSVVFDDAAHLDFIACFNRGEGNEKQNDVFNQIRSNLIDIIKSEQ